MPPFDPHTTTTTSTSMNMNMNMNNHMMYDYGHVPPPNSNSNPNPNPGYGGYAPPAYHGHSGFTMGQCQPYGAPPPPPPSAWGYPYGSPTMSMHGAPENNINTSTSNSNSNSVSAPKIMEPHENDVLMGRGGKNNQHQGNEKLRDMARSVRDRYKESSKKEKSNMSRELVQKVRELDPPGRFLKRNPVTSEWEDVGDEIAREKVSQVLRDAVSEWTGPKAQAKEKEKVKEKQEQEPNNNQNHTRQTPAPAPMPSIDVPAITTRTVTLTRTENETNNIMDPNAPNDKQTTTTVSILSAPSPLASSASTSPSQSPAPGPGLGPEPNYSTDHPPLRSRSDTADSDFSLLDDISIAESTDSGLDLLHSDTSSVSSNGVANNTAINNANNNRRFRRSPMPVQHVPFQSFRRKNKMNLLDRYSNMSMGTSNSDMSITSQLSTRTLDTQLSSKQLISQGAKQMSSRTLSSRQLSSRTLSSRQLSSRQLSSRQLSSRQLSSRQLSSRQLSNRTILSQQQRKNYLEMMGDSILSLESLSISGDCQSRQASRKNLFMDQYMNMDMGLSDFSLGSMAGEFPESSQPMRGGGGPKRPSVIIEGDLEELSEHENSSSSLNVKPQDLLDMYNSAGVGNSISNMTMNTLGTFSGHSRRSKGLYATGNSMRLDSGHSFSSEANDLQLDMLDDDLFDEMDVLDDADEFSSDFI